MISLQFTFAQFFLLCSHYVDRASSEVPATRERWLCVNRLVSRFNRGKTWRRMESITGYLHSRLSSRTDTTL